jgi:hypothetical protein
MMAACFSVSFGPDIADPLDIAPIALQRNDGTQWLQFTAGPWYSRLGLWLLRRYVKQIDAKLNP